MGKLFNNKFFVLFVAISFFFYFGFVHVSYAGRIVKAIITIAIIAVAIYTASLPALLVSTAAGLVASALFPCDPLIGFVVGAVAGGGISSGLGMNQALNVDVGFTNFNTTPGVAGIGSAAGCGGGGGGPSAGSGSSSGGTSGTPGSPLLSGYATNPIKSNGYCTTGFALSFDVSDAYQYGIYRDGNLINQGKVQDYPQATSPTTNPYSQARGWFTRTGGAESSPYSNVRQTVIRWDGETVFDGTAEAPVTSGGHTYTPGSYGGSVYGWDSDYSNSFSVTRN